MEAHKFYELKERLEEFKKFVKYNNEAEKEIGRALEIVEKEIADYEEERMEKIRQDNE